VVGPLDRRRTAHQLTKFRRLPYGPGQSGESGVQPSRGASPHSRSRA